jgi:hypothetical protein
MLYIHSLQALNPKSIDVESVYLVRELKQKTPYPFSEQKLGEQFASFFVSNTDKEIMETALQTIEPTMELVKTLMSANDSVHERCNIERTIQTLKEMPEALQNSMKYADEIVDMQANFTAKITPLLNNIPKLKNIEEKKAANNGLNIAFQTLLRRDGLAFNYNGIVHEAHIKHIADLSEGLGKGYLFHVTLEEELQKLNFETIKSRVAQEKLDEVAKIQTNVEIIKKGIDRAYDINMRMINWAVILFAYLKWVSSSK